MAHHLGHPRNLIVEQWEQRLRRHVARTETSATGENENVRLAGALLDGGSDRVDVVGHTLAPDDIRGEERESRDDNIAAAIVGIDAAAAVADGDLRPTPALVLGQITHSRRIRSCPA